MKQKTMATANVWTISGISYVTDLHVPVNHRRKGLGTGLVFDLLKKHTKLLVTSEYGSALLFWQSVSALDTVRVRAARQSALPTEMRLFLQNHGHLGLTSFWLYNCVC